MELSKRYNKVYVICGAYFKTGGTEVLHQLVYHVNKLGGNAYIAYINRVEGYPDCNPVFIDYVNDHTLNEEEIEDREDNVVIIPEGYPSYIYKYKKSKLAIWWLSVDNFECASNFNDDKIKDLLEDIKKYVHMHLVQSKYAEEYLLNNGFALNEISHLSDYINDCYFDNEFKNINTKRENYILYNPRRGAESTKNIIASAKGMKFIPIKDMTNDEVMELMKKSKIYMDFGNHPGKDRMPREAAICGCVVITGKHGSAAYQEDVGIPEKYKFDENVKCVEDVISMFWDVLFDFSNCSKEFDEYREKIRKEKDIFVDDIVSIFFTRK